MAESASLINGHQLLSLLLTQLRGQRAQSEPSLRDLGGESARVAYEMNLVTRWRIARAPRDVSPRLKVSGAKRIRAIPGPASQLSPSADRSDPELLA